MLLGEPTTRSKYCAFVSYSHHDAAWAEWVHSLIERHRVPRELVGQSTSKGLIQGRLGKVFIDRLELVAGALDEQITAALTQSDHLIVICSPKSRASARVNEEIRQFKAFRRGERILALIVSGSTAGVHDGCMPEALKFRVGADGRITTELDNEVLAADVRAKSYGKRLAGLKLVAGLLGIGLDELEQRQAAAERRERRTWVTIAATMSVLAVAAAGGAWVANDKRQEATANLALAEQRQEQSIRIARGFAGKVANLTDNLQIPSDKAEELLNTTGHVLNELSNISNRPELGLQSEAEMELYHAETAKRLDKSEVWEQRAKASQAAYRKLHDLQPNNTEYLQGLGKASFQVGMALRDQGYLANALNALSESLTVRSDLVRDNPHIRGDDAETIKRRAFRRDLSAVYLEMGIILKRQGHLSAAISHLRDALALRREINTASNGDSGAELDETVAMVELADALGLSGHRQHQLSLLAQAVERREALLQGTNGDVKVKRYLAWAHIFLGEALLDAGEGESALKVLRRAASLQGEVFHSDEKNADRQKDMAWAAGHLSDALLEAGDIHAAISGYGEALEKAERALNKDQTNLMRRRNVAYWLCRRAKALRLGGQIDEAKADLDRSIGFLQMDVGADRSNLQLASELGRAYLEQGRLEMQTRGRVVAGGSLGKAKDVFDSVSAKAPEVVPWQRLRDDANREMALLTAEGG